MPRFSEVRDSHSKKTLKLFTCVVAACKTTLLPKVEQQLWIDTDCSENDHILAKI